MSSKSVNKFLYLFREMMGAGAVSGAPTNNVGDGKIAGTAEAGDDPPVRKKKRKPTPVGRYGTRRTWRKNG